MVIIHSLRFPIADLRKDPAQRLAWWRRNLRQEKLELLLSKLSFNTETGADSRKSEIVFECRSIQGKEGVGRVSTWLLHYLINDINMDRQSPISRLNKPIYF